MTGKTTFPGHRQRGLPTSPFCLLHPHGELLETLADRGSAHRADVVGVEDSERYKERCTGLN
jgi:hypothetical protein